MATAACTFFDFCEHFRVCPFMVVVFARDLKQVGDVRRLEGRQIEIEGEVTGYDGRAELILRRPGQLRGDAAHILPLPKSTTRGTEGQVQRRHNALSETYQVIGKT